MHSSSFLNGKNNFMRPLSDIWRFFSKFIILSSVYFIRLFIYMNAKKIIIICIFTLNGIYTLFLQELLIGVK